MKPGRTSSPEVQTEDVEAEIVALLKGAHGPGAADFDVVDFWVGARGLVVLCNCATPSRSNATHYEQRVVAIPMQRGDAERILAAALRD